MITLGLVRRLGQPPIEIPFKVVVTDSRGVPFKGAMVYLSSGGRHLYDVSTNSGGSVEFPGVSGAIDVRVEVAGYVVTRRVENTDETLFVQVPVCSPGELLTVTELALLAGAGALAGAGWHWKISGLKITSEIILSAVVFNAVFRAGCRG